MKKLGFALKGQTFLKALGPLLHFSKLFNIEPHVFIYKARPNKKYDKVNDDIIKNILNIHGGGTICYTNNDEQVSEYLKSNNINCIVCQDAQHHHEFLLDKFKVFSISMFFDTLHFAQNKSNKETLEPYKTYFAFEFLYNKFVELSGDKFKWNAAFLGSPAFDHSLFVDMSGRFSAGSILFLTPPIGTVSNEVVQEINNLVDYCIERNIDFIMKDRKESPFVATKSFKRNKKIIYTNEEFGLPYTSMQLLMKTDIHITAYGTSIFESMFLGKPAINLKLNDKLTNNIGNFQIKNLYDMDFLYDNEQCVTTDTNLIEVYETMVTKRFPPLAELNSDKNFSINILNDIVKHI